MARVDVVAVLRRMAKQAGRYRYPESLLLEPPAGGFAALDRGTKEDYAAIDAVAVLIAAGRSVVAADRDGALTDADIARPDDALAACKPATGAEK